MENIIVEYHNVVDILIFNDKHQLALQKRASSDKSFPSHWDFSAGGHIDQNEEVQKTAEREIFEELGLSGHVTLILHEHYKYPAWNNPSVIRDTDMYIFKMFHNGPFKINTNEVEKAVFFDLQTIQKMIDQGDKFHPEFLLIWKKGIVTREV